jgi:hypothetical protein
MFQNRLDDDELVRTHSEEFLSEKSDVAFELLSEFDIDNAETTIRKFLALTSTSENCNAVRHSGQYRTVLRNRVA